jgi:nucleotide-binding universal stress UspA family protein
MEISRILAPTDLSPASDGALATAADLANRLGAGLTLLHVVREQDLEALTSARVPPRPIDFVCQDVEAALIAQYRRVVPVEARRRLRVEPAVAVGTPVVEILRAAQAEDADMIVMATHGRAGLARIVKGSVAEQVVHRSSCPVVTVRPAQAPALAAA